MEKGNTSASAPCRYKSEGTVKTGALMALTLVAANGEVSLLEMCIYYIPPELEK